MTDQRRVEEQLAKLEILVTEEVSKGRQELQSSQAKVLNSIDEMINDATAALASLVTTYREKLNKLEEYAIENEVNPDACVRNAKEEMEHYEKEALNEMTLYVEKTKTKVLKLYDTSLTQHLNIFTKVKEVEAKAKSPDLENLDFWLARQTKGIIEELAMLVTNTRRTAYARTEDILKYTEEKMNKCETKCNNLSEEVETCIIERCHDIKYLKRRNRSEIKTNLESKSLISRGIAQKKSIMKTDHRKKEGKKGVVIEEEESSKWRTLHGPSNSISGSMEDILNRFKIEYDPEKHEVDMKGSGSIADLKKKKTGKKN